MPPVLLVALGSAVGGAARWALSGWIDGRSGSGFPWGTLAVNALGGLLIGVGAAVIERESVRLLLIAGVLGGFTTFSAYSLQSLQLLQGGRLGLALGYALGSVVICLLACWAGWTLARMVAPTA
jgi:CrcB protein